jgi:uncharacterized membrane protein
MNKHRVDYIDALRGILILIMIMGHVDFGAAFDKYIHDGYPISHLVYYEMKSKQ